MSNSTSRGCQSLFVILGSCATLALCLMFACSINALYWVSQRPANAAPRVSAPRTTITNFEALPAGNATDGATVFTTMGCKACHALEPDQQIVGPSLAGVAARAATRQADYAAEKYLFESIVSPEAYTVANFNANIMPPNYGQRLSAQQLADLIAFLMTQ